MQAPDPDFPTDVERDALFGSLVRFDHVALAVSGGSDSMALMELVADWLAARRSLAAAIAIPKVTVVTVDHGLRAESAVEAEFVAASAATLGLDHKRLIWAGDKPTSGIQAAARAARYRLISAHLEQVAPGKRRAVVTAHTEDDQAETVLMRLARGSSLDGVAGIRAERRLSPLDPAILFRPLLAISRLRLRAFLESRGKQWIDDPSNADAAFERVRLRQAQPALNQLGLTAVNVARTARRLAAEREALDALADNWRRSRCRAVLPGLCVCVPHTALTDDPRAVVVRAFRLLVDAIGAKPEPMSLPGVEDLLARLRAAPNNHQETAARCLLRREGEKIWLTREPPRQLSNERATLSDSPAAGSTDVRAITVDCQAAGVATWDNRLRLAWDEALDVQLRVTAEAALTDLTPIARPLDVPAPVWAAASRTAPVVSVIGPTGMWHWRALKHAGFDDVVALQGLISGGLSGQPDALAPRARGPALRLNGRA